MSSSKKTTPVTEIPIYDLSKDPEVSELITVEPLREHLESSCSAATSFHRHSYNQILWFTKGTGTHWVDFRQYDYVDNSLLYVPHGAVHAFAEDLTVEGWLIHFDDVLLLGDKAKMNPLGLLRSYSFGGDPFYCLEKSELENWSQSFDLLQRELRSEESLGRSSIIEGLLRILAIHLCRCMQSRAVPAGIEHERYFKFLELVEQEYQRGLSVEEYAERLQVSSKTLSRSIHQVVNQSPSQVITARALLEAKRLLVHSDLSIKAIGAELGFLDPAYFVRFFHKLAGMTPGSFRNEW